MRARSGGLDLTVYLKALPLLVRNPAIVVVPLLMAVAGVLIGMTLSSSGAGMLTSGFAGFVITLLDLFGLAVACIIADEAWRNGRASFDRGWTEAQRRAGEILYAAIGMTFVFAVGQFSANLIGLFAYVLLALAALFMIWTIPAVAVGGIPGAAAIGASIERVRANPVIAVVLAVVCIAIGVVLPVFATAWITVQLFPYMASAIAAQLIGALVSAVATGYVALVMTKTYTDASFGRRW